MIKYTYIFIFLCFPLSISVPVKRGAQLEAKSKNDTSTPSNNCYFSLIRKSPAETQDRPEKSIVSTSCSGVEKSMNEWAVEFSKTSPSSENPYALLLCRGAGICDLDFSDSNVLAKWKDVKVCSHHGEELLTKWSDIMSGFMDKHIYRRRMSHGRAVACSMPNELGDAHDHRPVNKLQSLKVEEANALLTQKNILVHPGIPLCPSHKNFVNELVSKSSAPSPKKPKIEIDTDIISDDDCSEELYLPYDHQRIGSTKRSFLDFASGLGISRVCSNLPWSQLKITTRERKASAARRLIDYMLAMMVSDDTESFRNLVESKFVQMDTWTSGYSSDLDTIMKQISEQYFASEDKNNRILILSLVTNSVSYLKVEKYIPGLSGYMYDKSKKFARRQRDTKLVETRVLEKYNRAAVEAFIEFITSPIVMISLPYGVRKVKLSDGSKMQIPDSIRQQSATEIIEMFKKICEANNRQDLVLGTSTMYKILNVCAATKRESTTCVDYFIAQGMESFDGLHSILDYWKDLTLFDADVIKQMKGELFQAAQYFRTDYRLHVKNVSRIADHCAVFALSDPNNAQLATSCSLGQDSHTHDLRCDRCEKSNAILDKLEAHAKEFVTEEEQHASLTEGTMLAKHREELELIKKYRKGIFEMKKHLLRSAVTNEERQNITTELKDNEALITMDFAQKFLPKWHREKQSDYFGKKGISYHISHVAARIGKVHVQHSFVHIFEGSVTQDNKLVVLTLSHFLPELKKVGIKKVFLRSDNAGAYHSASTIGSLHWLIQKTGMTIGSYTFSEAQNGKSSSDRDANRVKRRVKEYINQGHDVTTSTEFFKALKENPPNGLSVYHGSVTATDQGGTDWKGISSLNYFTIEKNGVRAKRYGGIGAGIFVQKSTLKPIKGTFQFSDEAGFLASKIDSDALRKKEREAVEKGLETTFWYHPKCTKASKCLKEPDDVTSTVQEHVPNNVLGDLYSCPEHGCSSTFLRYSNLEQHILRGQHNVAPERITERDYALNFFARKLENANSDYTCPVVEAAVLKLKESKLETRLSSGWALPERKPRKAFGKNVVSFLKDCFDQGVKNKKPMNPIVVAELMHTSKKFSVDELLDSRQISGFFSREADKRRHTNPASSTIAAVSQNRSRRFYRRTSPHRRRQRRNNVKLEIKDPLEYVESEDEHPDAGWIRFIKMEEYWNLFDEFFEATLKHAAEIFLPFQ